MKRFAASIFCVLTMVMAIAQNDSISIVGKVTDADNEPLEACIVTALAPADSAILAYSMTGEEGKYNLLFKPSSDQVLLRLSGFNIKGQVKRIPAKSQSVNFQAQEESITLREVQVKAQRLWGSRDTLNFLVAAYMKEHDRTIGDVLKQLPGITIDNGVIKYQGTPINHFFIENMDVLQGRYNIATKGIRAEDVATVQVLENHEHVKALQDQVPTESAAINLKLKSKAKGVWTRSASVGLGWDDELLWDTDINLMYFGKNRQHVLYYGNENTGSSSSITSSHYGGSSLGATVLTSIISPGSSPVGSTLENNRHSVNLSNVSKFNSSAQLHYNLTYLHDIQRRNSYSQTTYLIPQGDIRILSEDISIHNTINDATVKLTYEDNRERRFVENKLELIGHWTEASGVVESNDALIRQKAPYRNLGLENSTRWVHRTGEGGGFQLLSTNSVQTTPQSLTVTGAMQARQEVDLTRVRSDNHFSLVKDLRRHRWTIVPTADIDFNYVGLESTLRSKLSDHGTMDYLNLTASMGARLTYVKDELRLNINLPVSLAYTTVMRQTDASKVRLSPSMNLLWKVNDNWTLSSDANFSTFQTPWTQLITTFIMSNYRTLSRYTASLNDSHSTSANAKINYKDILNEFFAYVQGGYSRSWSDIVLGTTIDEDAHTILQAQYLPNHSDNYNLRASVSKGIDWHGVKMEGNAIYRRSDSQMLRQDIKTDFCSQTYTFNGSLSGNIIKQVQVGYNCDWSRTNTWSPNVDLTDKTTIQTFSQRANLNLTLLPGRLFMKLTGNHTHNSGFEGKKDYVFADASLTYKTKSKIEVVLSLDNILNTRTFISRSSDDMTEYYKVYHLRPRSVMLKTHFIF